MIDERHSLGVEAVAVVLVLIALNCFPEGRTLRVFSLG